MLHSKKFASRLVWVIAIFVLLYTWGCSDVERNESANASVSGFGAWPELYAGEASLDEKIAGAEVIVRAKLISVEATTERRTGSRRYLAALDFKFQVLDYLIGSGGKEVVAFAYNDIFMFNKEEDALAKAKLMLEERDSTWDSREAILFLASHSGFESSMQPDRYWFGRDRPGDEDGYSIASRYTKAWLPEALPLNSSGESLQSPDSSEGSQTSERWFLTDIPSIPDSSSGDRALDVSNSPSNTVEQPAMALSALQKRIAEIELEAAASQDADAYRLCLALKFYRERKANYKKGEGNYTPAYHRTDLNINSGMPSESRVGVTFISTIVKKFYDAAHVDQFGGLCCIVAPAPKGQVDGRIAGS